MYLEVTIVNDYTGQQRFCPMRKMSVADVFLEAEFKYVSIISLITHTFPSRLKGWNLLRQDTSVFLPWAP